MDDWEITSDENEIPDYMVNFPALNYLLPRWMLEEKKNVNVQNFRPEYIVEHALILLHCLYFDLDKKFDISMSRFCKSSSERKDIYDFFNAGQILKKYRAYDDYVNKLIYSKILDKTFVGEYDIINKINEEISDLGYDLEVCEDECYVDSEIEWENISKEIEKLKKIKNANEIKHLIEIENELAKLHSCIKHVDYDKDATEDFMNELAKELVSHKCEYDCNNCYNWSFSQTDHSYLKERVYEMKDEIDEQGEDLNIVRYRKDIAEKYIKLFTWNINFDCEVMPILAEYICMDIVNIIKKYAVTYKMLDKIKL